MKVLICGSRNWTDRRTIEKYIDGLWADYGPELTIIEGEAPGADSLARDVASERGITVARYFADWKRDGRRAGIIRNIAMLNEFPGLVLAFRRDDSRGTTHTITEAQRRGISVQIVEAEPPHEREDE